MSKNIQLRKLFNIKYHIFSFIKAITELMALNSIKNI